MEVQLDIILNLCGLRLAVLAAELSTTAKECWATTWFATTPLEETWWAPASTLRWQSLCSRLINTHPPRPKRCSGSKTVWRIFQLRAQRVQLARPPLPVSTHCAGLPRNYSSNVRWSLFIRNRYSASSLMFKNLARGETSQAITSLTIQNSLDVITR